MKLYFQAFINFEYSDWAKFLPIAEFTYKNTKIASISYILFQFNYKYNFYIFY